MEAQLIVAQSAFSPLLPVVKMMMGAAPLAATIIMTTTAAPVVEIALSKKMKSVMAIAPPCATTPIVAL